MKKRLCLVLAMSLLLPVFAACRNTSEQPQTTTVPAVTEPDHTAGMEALNGKKVIFIGNSHTYYSRCVLNQKQNTVFQTRVGDKGIFYQLCKANGIEVEVTNYTFGSHQLSDIYSGSCAADRNHDGHDHMADITDFNYDYVILQQGTKAPENDLVGDVEKMVAPFKEANPNVQVIFLVHQLVYTRDYKWLEKVAILEEAGVTVVDWGGMLHGVVQGTEVVPNSQQTFNLNSFVISQSDSDGYHPNLLAGYITALMTYCAISGEKAEGQPWEFKNSDILSKTAITAYRNSYYTYDPDTNFDAVMLSETEMLGFQELIDQYMAK